MNIFELHEKMTAQIEAAAKAAWESYHRSPWPKNQWQWEEAIKAALTAAAQVGEISSDRELKLLRDIERLVIEKTTIIERCAQVAEKAVLPSDLRPECIAAAIRKLKDAS